jgi:hypothetical protein
MDSLQRVETHSFPTRLRKQKLAVFTLALGRLSSLLSMRSPSLSFSACELSDIESLPDLHDSLRSALILPPLVIGPEAVWGPQNGAVRPTPTGPILSLGGASCALDRGPRVSLQSTLCKAAPDLFKASYLSWYWYG